MPSGELPSIDSPLFTLLDLIFQALADAGITPGGGGEGTLIGEDPVVSELLGAVKDQELAHTELLELVVRELRKINIHLSVLTNEEVDEADVETEQEP